MSTWINQICSQPTPPLIQKSNQIQLKKTRLDTTPSPLETSAAQGPLPSQLGRTATNSPIIVQQPSPIQSPIEEIPQTLPSRRPTKTTLPDVVTQSTHSQSPVKKIPEKCQADDQQKHLSEILYLKLHKVLIR